MRLELRERLGGSSESRDDSVARHCVVGDSATGNNGGGGELEATDWTCEGATDSGADGSNEQGC